MSFEYCEGEGDDGTLRGQLHQEYIPSPEQRASSKYTYHGAAAVE